VPGLEVRLVDSDGQEALVGDVGGHLSLVDRIKDLIIVSGLNVYPAQVEDVQKLHPSVESAAVVGAPIDPAASGSLPMSESVALSSKKTS
jgi:acyl-CoA synthetase (AMP-forming)/AMP-acid ligase II